MFTPVGNRYHYLWSEYPVSIIANYPNLRPSLLIDLANSQTLDPRITFSRSSTGAYYDGKTVAIAEQNLLLQSQTFSTSPWFTNAATIGTLTTAPDGTTTAAPLTATAVAGQHNVYQSYTVAVVGNTYTVSVYAQAGTYNLFYLGDLFGGKFAATFNLSTGALVSLVAGTSATITQYGSTTWYRCSITWTQSQYTTVAPSFIGYPSGATITSTSVSYTGDGTSGVKIWGAQLEQRSSATAYNVTTTAFLTNYVPMLLNAVANQPRLDFSPVTGESLGLLVEESRTNLIYQSETFTASPWADVVGSTATRAQSGWNFGFNVGQITATAANGGIRQTVSGLTSGQQYTLSFFLQSTLTNIYLFTENGASAYGTQCSATINAVTGAVSGSTGFVSITSTALGSGRVYQVVFPAAGGSLSANLEWKTATTGVPFYLGRPQFEAGTGATSYVATAAAPVTRSADSATIAGINFSSWYNQSQGTFYFIYTRINTGSATTYPQLFSTENVLEFSDGTSEVFKNTSANVQFTAAGVSKNERKAAFTYSPAVGYGAIIDAGTYTTNPSSPVTKIQPTYLSFGGNQSSNPSSNYIKKIAYYPQALTTVQLQALTGS